MKKQYLEIGKIVATQGLSGEVRVQYYCDSAEVICSFDRLFLGKEKTEYAVERARPHKTLAILKLSHTDTIEQAKLLVGKMLYMNRDDAELDEDTYFIADLIGMSVIDADTGRNYGKIDDVYQNGAADVYSVRTPDGKQLMFPAIPEVLLDVDTDKDIMTIRPLEGLFEDTEEIANDQD